MENSHDTHGKGGASHCSVKEYVTGLLLSVFLTVIPFGVVMTKALSPGMAMAVIIICCIAQLFVQLVFFLHMNTSSEQSWNVMSGLYALSVVVILIIGSMWIFNHLHHNMLMGH